LLESHVSSTNMHLQLVSVSLKRPRSFKTASAVVNIRITRQPAHFKCCFGIPRWKETAQ